ncbi:hypothetical protein QR680_013452 [Steinernema hermaphroditum]|uniref:PID domain-containing protein n=1 Tax=Steinernema hermaphroditum TaxID=289476 RepID=A0AA39I744_9BILA|nr:hypothetical protein QR680_013452 [Steinernema hermaphroditum]
MSSTAMQRRGSRGSPSRLHFGEPVLRRRDEASIEIEADVGDRRHHAFQEREEEEYYYVHSRPLSEQGSDTATMHFTEDDRLERRADDEERLREHHEEHSEEHRLRRSDYERSRRHELAYEGAQRQQDRYEYEEAEERQQRYQKKAPGGGRRSFQRDREDEMPIDYSPQDFRQSFAAIDAASRENVRVRQHGDTTIMTEHRDPYSFYWQLDQIRKAEEEPPRRPPPVDYVIDEEEADEETYEAPRQESVVLSPDSHDSGVNLVESQYSRPQRVEELPAKQLPAGWERHEDPSGYSYYWHVDTGTIQREPPKAPRPPAMSPPPPMKSRTPSPPPASYTSRYTQADAEPPKQVVQMPAQQPIITEHAFKQTTTKRRIENRDESEENDAGFDDDDRKPVRFAVRSLGWTEIAEEDLTAEKSSRAVNRAIIDLAGGVTMDNVSKWGDGRELIMELDDQDLTLIDPDTMNVVHSEKIHQIRVWGVGRDNGRDFAYVARDRTSRRFMCHVFRCDTPARTIANTLRDICKRLMLQRRPNVLHSLDTHSSVGAERRLTRESSLPTPIEEPKKLIRCHFLGVTQVPRATGIDILNDAVDRLVNQLLCPNVFIQDYHSKTDKSEGNWKGAMFGDHSQYRVRPERWILADVSIAPSTITINEVGGGQIAQCRVRYLSFLGIGSDVKHCAFIMHTSSDNFMCYVFHVEPSAGAMAKTIEAACKLRYQKVLDAHTAKSSAAASAIANGKGWGDSLREAFGSMRERLSTSSSRQSLSKV